MLLLLAAWLGVFAGPQDSSPDLLARVADQAETFSRKAPALLAEETLEQRTLQGSGSRFRVGKSASQFPELYLGRTIISEYTIAPLKDSESKDLVEFRQAISVDGRIVQSAEKARHALSLGVQSASERVRKRMLEDFAKYGLVDVATDYALILLAFTSRGQEQLTILPSDEERVGADDASVFSWAQSAEGGGELIFAGRQAARIPLAGKLWVRKSDGVPLRISVWAAQSVSGRSIRDEATIDYAMSPRGFVVPVAVLHRHVVDGELKTENQYRYSPFRLFAADTQVEYPPSAPPPPQ
jgi:hypothetical protein